MSNNDKQMIISKIKWNIFQEFAPEWRIFKCRSEIFIFVEENIEFQSSEMLQNEGFLNVTVNIFTMVEENFEFESSEMLQNEGFLNITVNIFTMVE